jgi:hypothetical protein
MIADERVEAIQSREDFVRFARSLARTVDQDPEAWENNDLQSFLRAMASWVEDMDGYYRNVGEPTPEAPSWKVLGQILAAATVYE